jgi:hypothetical protein
MHLHPRFLFPLALSLLVLLPAAIRFNRQAGGQPR